MPTIQTLKFLFLFTFTPFLSLSQEITQDAITTAGGSTFIASEHFSWSLGQVFTEKLSSDVVVFTQGFQQPFLKKASSVFDFEHLDAVSVFPNPASEFFTLYTEHLHPLEVRIFNAFGQSILSDTFTSKKAFYINKLPPGSYFVQISKNGQLLQLCKIQKI